MTGPASRIAWALALLVIFVFVLPCCEGESDGEDEAAVFCDVVEGDWRAQVLAPAQSVIFPASAGWYDPAGTVYELNPEDLRAGGVDVIVAPGTLVLDFGRNVAGFLALGVRNAAGLSFDLRFSEAYQFIWDTQPRLYDLLTRLGIPPVWLPRYHEHRLDGYADFEDPVQVGAYRYVRMDVHEGAARLDYAYVRFTSRRTTADDLAGYFLCDDELLNRVWYAGVYTLDLCTIRSNEGCSTGDRTIGRGEWSLVDGSKRDRMIWTGDLFIGSGVDFVSRTDHLAAVDSLDYLAGWQRPGGRLPGCSPVGALGLGAYLFLEYNLFWVLTAWDQYLFSGDMARLEERYRVTRGVLEHVARRTRGGLVHVGPASSGTWCWSLSRGGKASFINVLFELALQKAALMADALGHGQEAEAYRQQSWQLRQMINEFLWDEDRGIYVESDGDRAHVPLDANAVAVLSGVAQERRRRIIDYLLVHHDGPFGLVNVDPAYDRTSYGVGFHNRRAIGFPNYFAARAMFEAGNDDAALDVIRRCFGHMAASDPASTMWEFIGEDGRPEMSYVGLGHAWSAGATVLLTQYVLGVRPLEAGYVRFVVSPHLGGLRHVEGRVPTPHGPIFVKLDLGDRGLLVYLDVPAGTLAELRVPEEYGAWEDSAGARGTADGEGLTVGAGSRCMLFTAR